jgi:hypothetical protein
MEERGKKIIYRLFQTKQRRRGKRRRKGKVEEGRGGERKEEELRGGKGNGNFLSTMKKR